MQSNPILGKTIRWTYSDGPTKGQQFEHTFAADGTVTYRMVDAGAKNAATQATKKEKVHYDVERINEQVYAVSYLAPDSGYTLTTILDTDKQTVVSFASNEDKLIVQHGTYQAI